MTPFEAVSFRNRQGQLLHGMLHAPDPAVARGVCILMLSPGIKGRVGPHRLYLKMAERLVPLGFHLLRFDFYGLGDSEGELGEDVLADMYNTIQGGRYAEDTIAAMDWIAANCGIRRFVGSGLCGGSITALHAAARDDRVEALLGIGLPVVLDGGEANWGRFLTRQQKQQERRGLVTRMFRPRSWWRFLSGQSDYRVIGRVLPQLVGLRSPFRSRAKAATAAQAPDDTNPLFAPAFLQLLARGRPALLVYSGGDRLLAQFEEKFESRHREQIGADRRGYRVHEIPNANHIMSSREWVAELCEVSAAWLSRTF
jgi:pimeloyl-ACP methyl ester carboxylesterase